MAKNIYVASIHRGRTTIWSAPISEMVDGIFGYTLECGHSWNSRIPRYPKSKASLINALNKSADECRRYNDYYREATEAEVKYFNENAKGNSVTIWD